MFLSRVDAGVTTTLCCPWGATRWASSQWTRLNSNQEVSVCMRLFLLFLFFFFLPKTFLSAGSYFWKRTLQTAETFLRSSLGTFDLDPCDKRACNETCLNLDLRTNSRRFNTQSLFWFMSFVHSLVSHFDLGYSSRTWLWCLLPILFHRPCTWSLFTAVCGYWRFDFSSIPHNE